MMVLASIEAARTAQSVPSLVYELDVRDMANPFLANRRGDHPVSYPMGTRTISAEVKRPGPEAGSSLPSSIELKNDSS
jgi:hypothetical protein